MAAQNAKFKNISKKEIMNTIAEHSLELEQFSVVEIGLFGSFVREDTHPDSDIDILVKLSNKTFRNYMGLKLFLEDLLGRNIDLVLADAVKPRIKPIVFNEVEYIVQRFDKLS